MPRNPDQILILDKDSTIMGRDFRIPDGVSSFIKAQSEERRVIIATDAGDPRNIADRGEIRERIELSLRDINGSISGLFTGDLFSDAFNGKLYVSEDASIRRIDEDYERIHFTATLRKEVSRLIEEESKLQASITRNWKPGEREDIDTEDYFKYMTYGHHTDPAYIRSDFIQRSLGEISVAIRSHPTLFHKETGKQFDNTRIYKAKSLKDIDLVLRLFGGKDYDKLKSVMLGNECDGSSMISHPETPVIVVDNETWHIRRRVSILLDTLFSQTESPDSIFDELYASGESQEDFTRKVRIGEHSFLFKKDTTRVIYEKES